MKVLFAANAARLEGGASQSLLELVSALSADGRVQPLVTVPGEGALTDALDERAIPWCVIPTPAWVAYTDPERHIGLFATSRLRASRLMDVTRHLPAWVALLRREQPSVVVTNTATIPTPAIACLVTRIPHVWWLHELMSPRFGSWYVLGERLSQGAIGALSQRVLVVSKAVEQKFARIGTRKLRVVYLGMAVPAASENPSTRGRLRVLSLGHQTSAKGSETAVRALAAVNPAEAQVMLRLVGPATPEYRRVLEQLATDLAVRDRVELGDFTSDPYAEIEWSNVLLTCAIDEAFGRSTVEGLQSGRPVIGARSAGTLEIVTDGVDGILFEPGDVAAAARAMQALALDPLQLEMMSRAARSLNACRYPIGAQVAGVADVLLEAVHERHH